VTTFGDAVGVPVGVPVGVLVGVPVGVDTGLQSCATWAAVNVVLAPCRRYAFPVSRTAQCAAE
jgi:ethanolamine utilization microcompartment shell protein EutL